MFSFEGEKIKIKPMQMGRTGETAHLLGGDVLWRADVRKNYQMRSSDNPYRVDMVAYPIYKRTHKGCWIFDDSGRKRFILDTSSRKWAWPTKREALISFRRRKQIQVDILTQQLKRSKDAYALSKKMLKPRNFKVFNEAR